MKQFIIILIAIVLIGCNQSPVAPEQVVSGDYPVVVSGTIPCDASGAYGGFVVNIDPGKFILCTGTVKATDSTWTDAKIVSDFDSGIIRFESYRQCAEYKLLLW